MVDLGKSSDALDTLAAVRLDPDLSVRGRDARATI
jgi:hypothetical protein